MIYLYIKMHTKTGIKYFGKTTRNPFNYFGSGVKWCNHIKKHGKEYVVTKEVWGFDDQKLCTEFAISFSKKHDIVNSSEWANLIIEDGLTGWGIGNTHNKGKKHSPETIKKISNSHKGLRCLKGNIQSEEHVVARTQSRKNNNQEWHSTSTKNKIKNRLGNPIKVTINNEVIDLPSKKSLGNLLGLTPQGGLYVIKNQALWKKYNISSIIYSGHQ